jgi:hypothetical protein
MLKPRPTNGRPGIEPPSCCYRSIREHACVQPDTGQLAAPRPPPGRARARTARARGRPGPKGQRVTLPEPRTCVRTHVRRDSRVNYQPPERPFRFITATEFLICRLINVRALNRSRTFIPVGMAPFKINLITFSRFYRAIKTPTRETRVITEPTKLQEIRIGPLSHSKTVTTRCTKQKCRKKSYRFCAI